MRSAGCPRGCRVLPLTLDSNISQAADAERSFTYIDTGQPRDRDLVRIGSDRIGSGVALICAQLRSVTVVAVARRFH